jgi:hypothetical protein
MSKLADFALWMNTKGWSTKESVGDYEVLRMKHPLSSDLLLVYQKIGAEHCTVYGTGLHFVRRWLDARKEEKKDAPRNI